ncbi:hypothetical protein H9P43_002008 [Blastocladiella emersonii ATCC 22665]|nr:hypothetical protein H9P43_002008 [Blastocladiella emersonii ATCC 22665]
MVAASDAHVAPAGVNHAETVDIYVRNVNDAGTADPRELDDRDDIVRSGAKGSAGAAAVATPTGWRGLLRTRRRKVLACCLSFFLVLILFVVIAYFAIVPNIVRGKFAKSQLFLYQNSVDVDLYANSPQVNVKMDSELFVYGTDIETKFDPETWVVKTGDGVTIVDELPMPAKTTYIDKRYNMVMDAPVKLGNLDKLGELLRMLSSPEGISDAVGNIEIHTKMGVTLFGMHLYSNLDAVKKYDLRGLSFAKIFDNMLTGKPLPGFLGEKMPEDPTLAKYPRPAPRKADPLQVKSVVMTTNDKGFSVTADLDYDNPTPFATNIGGLSLVVKLYDTPVLRIGVRDVNLVRGKGSMKPSLDLELLEDYPKIGDLLRNAVVDFMGKGTLPVAIAGPINLLAKENASAGAKVVPAEWMNKATAPLAITIPPALIAKATAGDAKDANKSAASAAPSLLSQLGIKVGLAMDADKITVPVKVTLPKSLSLPQLKLDYNLGVNLYADAAKFLGISVNDLQIAKPKDTDSGNVASTTIVLTPDNSAPAAAGIAKFVENVLYSDSIAQLTVKDIAVTPAAKDAAECKWCTALFAKLDFPLPIQSVPLKKTLIDLVSKPAAPAAAAGASSAPGIKINGIDIKQEADSPAITVTADLDLAAPIAMIDTVNVPFAKVDFQVDDATAVTVSLPSGVQVNGDSAKLKVAVRATFGNSADVQTKIAALVSRFLGTQDGASKLAVTGVAFGAADKPFKTFELVNVHLTTDDVKEILAAKPASGPGLVLPPGLIKPTGVDVAMTAANTIMASVSAQIMNPFPISASIGSLSLSALLNDQTLVTVTLPPLAISASGTNALELKDIKIELGTSDALPPMIADLVGKVLAKQPLTGTVGVTGINLGAPASGKPEATIQTLARVRITKDLAALAAAPASSAGSVLDTSALIPAGGLALPTPKLVSASVATKEGATLALGVALDIANPLPVSVKIPFIGLSVGLDNAGEVAGVSIEGLDLKRGTGRLALTVTLRMNNDEAVQNRVAQVVAQALAGQNVDGALIISRILLGVSPSETTKLLSAVSVPVPLASLVNGAGSLGAGNNPDAPSPLSGALAGFDKPEIKNIRVATLDGGRVAVSLAAAFNNPLPVSVDIGYLALQTRVSGAPFIGISASGIKVAAGGANNLELTVNLDFASGEDTQVAVKNLVTELLYLKEWKSTVGVGSLVLGVNDKDTIRTLSRVNVDLPVTTFVTPAKLAELTAGLGKSSGSSGSGASPLAMLKDLSVDVQRGDRINVKTTLALALPVSLDIGFVSVTARLNRIAAAVLQLNGLKTGDKPELAVNLDITIQDSDALASVIAGLVRDVVAKKPELPYLVGITALRFGKDPAKPIDTFARVEADLPLAMLGLPGKSTDGAPSPLAGLVKLNGIKDVKVATKGGKRVQADLVANLGLPFKVSLNVPVIMVRVRVDDTQIVTVQTGVSLKPDSADLALSVGVTFDDNDKTQGMVAALVQQVLGGKGGDVASQLIVTGIEVGAASDDTITAFAKVEVAVPLRDLLKGGLPSLPASGGNSTASPVALSDVKVEAKTGAVVDVSLKAALGFAFPVTVDVGYIAATIGLNRNDMVVLSVSGLQASPATKELALTISAKFLTSDALSGDLSATAGAVLRKLAGDSIDVPGSVSVGGIVFGVSASDNIALLSKVFVDLRVADLLAKLPAGGAGGDAPKLLGGVSNITVAALPGDVIKAGLVAQINLPMKLDVNIPYIGVGAALDNVLLARVAVEGLRITPQSNNVAINLSVLIEDKEEAQNKIADVVKAILYSKDPVPNFAVVTGFEFGLSPTDRVTTFSAVKAGAKVADLVNKVKEIVSAPPTAGAPSLIAGVRDIAVDVKPGATVEVGLTAELAQALPLSLDIGFVTATLGLNKSPLVTLTLGAIKASPASKDLSLKLSAKFYESAELGADLKALVLAVLKKSELTGYVSVANFALGAKPDDNVALFSRAVVALPIGTIMSKIPANGAGAGASLPMPKIKGFSNLRISSMPKDVLNATFGLGLELPFKASINVPFVGAALAIDTTPILKVGVSGLKVTPENSDLSLGVMVQFIDTPEAQAKIAALAQAIFVEKKPVESLLIVTGATVGVSAEDAVKTFQQVVVPLPIKDLVAQIGSGNGGIALPAPANGTALVSVKDVKVAAVSGGIVEASAVAALGVSFPVSVQVGYIGVNVGLNANTMVVLSVSNLDVSLQSKELAVKVSAKFLTSDSLSNDLSATVGAVLRKLSGEAVDVPGALSVGGLVFGSSESDNVALLSGVTVQKPVAELLAMLPTTPAQPDAPKLLGAISNVTVAATTGDVIAASLVAQINLPMKLDVNIPYIGVGAALDNQLLARVMVDGLRISPASNAVSVKVAVKFEDTDEAQNKVADVVKAVLFSKDPVNNFAVVTGFEFGLSPSDRVTTFASVKAGAKVADLVNKVKQIIAAPPAPGTPSLITGVKDIVVDVKPKNTVELGLTAQLAQALPLSLDIGYIGGVLGLNKNPLVALSIGAIRATPESKEISLKLSATLFESAELGADLRDLVLAVVKKTEVTGYLTVSRLALGVKPDDFIGTFSRAVVAVPMGTLVAAIPQQGSGASLPMPKLKGLRDLKVATLPNDVIQASFALGLDMPFKASLNLPFVGAAVAVDRTVIAKVGVSGIKITPENADLSLGVQVQIADTPEAQDMVAKLVRSVLFETNPITNILMITGVQLGISAEESIKTFQQVVVPIPLQDLVKDIPKGLPAIGGGDKPLPISAKDIKVAVRPGGAVDLSLVAVLNNLTFPADVNVGFVSATLGLNSHSLVTVAVDGLKVSPSTKELALAVSLQFSNADDIAADLAQLVDAVFNKKEVTGFAMITGAAFGASRQDNIALLSKAVVAIPLSQFSKQLGALPDALGQALAGVGKGPSPVQIKSLGVAAKENALIEVSTELALGIQIPVSVDVGFINVDAQLGPLKAVSLQILGVKVAPDTKTLALALRVQVYDTPQLAQVIAKVAGDIAGGNLNQAITVTGVSVGVSAEDSIRTFAKIALPINLAPVLGAAPAIPADVAKDPNSLLAKLNPKLGEIKLVTLPERVIALTAKASFSNPLPVNVDLGFLSVGIGMDGERIADIRLRGFKMAPGDNGINLDLSVQLAQGDAAKVGGAIMDVLQGKLDGHRITVLGLELGSSEQNHIRALGLARIELPVARLTTPEAIGKFRASLPGLIAGGAGNGNSTASPLALSDVKINMQSPGPIIIQIAGELKTPTSVDVDVGFVQAAFALGPDPNSMPNPPLVGLQVRGLKVGGNKLGLVLVVNPYDTEANQNLVAALVASLLGGKELPDVTAFAAGLSIGASDSDKSDILSRTALALPVKALVKGPIALPKPGSGGAAAMPKINPTDISVSIENKYTVRIGAKIAINNPTPVSAVVGYVAANIEVNGLLFGNFAIDKPIAIGKGDNTLDLSLAINLNQDPKLEDAVAGLVKALLGGELKGIDAGVSGLVIGANKDAATKLLSKASIKQTVSLEGAPKPEVPAVKLDRVVAAITPAGLDASVPIVLPFKFSLAGIKDLNVDVFAGGNPMLHAAIGGLAADKSDRLTLKAVTTVNAQVAAPALNGVYEAIKAGKPIQGLSVGGVNLALSNGETFSLLSKISASMPPKTIADLQFEVKLHNAFKGEMDTKTLLDIPIPMELTAGNLFFEVHSPRGKTGNVNRRLIVRSEDKGFIVRIKSTLGWDLIEMGKVVANMESEMKFLKKFDLKTLDNKPVPWFNTVANGINVRLTPKWAKFDSPDDL